MFNNPTVLGLYAQARMIDDLSPRLVAPVPPRRRNPLAALFAIRQIVSTHNYTGPGIPRPA
jgi:hypothetical protein